MSLLLQKGESFIKHALIACSAFTLLFMMLTIVIDVVGRYFFNHPLKGGTELTEIGLAIIVSSALPIVTWEDKHIVVDLLDKYLTRIVIKLQYIASALIGMFGYSLVGVRVFEYAARSARRNEVTEYLEVPTSLIQYFIGTICVVIAIGLFFFVLIPQTCSLFSKTQKNSA